MSRESDKERHTDLKKAKDHLATIEAAEGKLKDFYQTVKHNLENATDDK